MASGGDQTMGAWGITMRESDYDPDLLDIIVGGTAKADSLFVF